MKYIKINCNKEVKFEFETQNEHNNLLNHSLMNLFGASFVKN